METIYTIPLNEVFSEDCGCPFCKIRAKLEAEALTYTLGGAMMEPDVRTEMNRLGFCRDHFGKLKESKNKLALALILETRLEELLTHEEEALAGDCFVCTNIDRHMERYMANCAHMFTAAPAFQIKFRKQEFFCLPHAKLLMHAGKRSLRRKQFEAFKQELMSVQRRHLKRLKDDARKFADSFDYRNTDKELGGEKKVLENATSVM